VRILHSYRWRRRLTITAILLGLAGPLIYLGVHYSSAGSSGEATGPVIPDYVQPTKAPFTKAKQRAVRRVLKEFISTAVVRHDVARAWNIAGPTLKEGVTRKEWNRGDIPVVPYPAANRGLGQWSYVQYSYTKSVGLEVFLFPKPGSGWSALTADVEVVKGGNGRWLVDYWMPKKFHGPPAVAAKTKAKVKKAKAAVKAKSRQRTTRQAAPDEATPDVRRGGLWWILPVGLLSLAVVLPLSIGLVFWYRNRKAERDYLRSVSR
jgi:hypothetical protein